MLSIQQKDTVSPARLLEMLSDRFGAFEAIAYSSITLARYVSEEELSMDLLVAEAILEFADDLRAAVARVDRRAEATVAEDS
jgi:hypothetical protein